MRETAKRNQQNPSKVRPRALAFGLIALVVGSTACGASNGSNNATTSSQSVSATTGTSQATPATGPTTEGSTPGSSVPGSTTTTTIPPTPGPRADLARAATLQAADFGPPYEEFSPAGERDIKNDPCATPYSEVIADLSQGSVQAGPIMKRMGEKNGGPYVSSRGYVFSDEAKAQAWIAAVNGDAWAECERQELLKFQVANKNDSVPSLVRRTDPTLGQAGFESLAVFSYSNAEAKDFGYVNYLFYRLGKVVMKITNDYSQPADEAALAEMSKIQSAALAKTYERVNALK